MTAHAPSRCADDAHTWKRRVMTAEEAANDPWRCFGWLVLDPDGSYDGPDVNAWYEEPGHSGPECELCGERFCAACNRRRWSDIAHADNVARLGLLP